MTDFPAKPEEGRPAGQITDDRAEDRRWRLMADVALFQGKLLLDGLRDLVLSPVSLGAALLGIVTSRDEPGRFFYRLMQWGRWSDQTINLFHSKGAPQAEPPGSEAGHTHIDRLADELERAVIERYAQSTLAQAAKQSIDRGLDRVNAAPSIDQKKLREAARRIVRGLERAGIGRSQKEADRDPPVQAGTSAEKDKE